MSLNTSQRLQSLDAFRGFTIAGMILVNNPGTWSSIYPQLEHAEWNGWTFTDWIFPFFLFIVGVAMTFSLANRKARGVPDKQLLLQVLRRAAIIFGLGLFLAGFPYFNLSTIRIPGVLQRIAVCYLVSSFIVVKTNLRTQVTIAIGLLLGYWALMEFLPVPEFGAGLYEKGRNFAAYIDSLVLSGHMWSATKTWDPEGVISTIPAIVSTLFGVFTGNLLHSNKSGAEKTSLMFILGNIALLLGVLLNNWLPINKSLWTSSYTIFMAGWALICLATFYWFIDVKGFKKWAHPFVVYGMNAIAVFVLSGVIGRLLVLIKVSSPSGEQVALKSFLFDNYFLPQASPINASLAFAIIWIVGMYLIVWIMWKKKWFLKV